MARIETKSLTKKISCMSIIFNYHACSIIFDSFTKLSPFKTKVFLLLVDQLFYTSKHKSTIKIKNKIKQLKTKIRGFTVVDTDEKE